MYNYFFSFHCNKDGDTMLGNTVLETNMRVKDCDSAEHMSVWFKEAKKEIERALGVTNVVILNFKHLGKQSKQREVKGD